MVVNLKFVVAQHPPHSWVEDRSSLILSPLRSGAVLALKVATQIAGPAADEVLGPDLNKKIKSASSAENLIGTVPVLGWLTGLWKDAKRNGLEECLLQISQLEKMGGQEELLFVELQRAAHAGHTDSMVKLGKIYIKKNEVEKAKEWFLKAAESEEPHPVAMFELYSLSKSPESEKWLDKAKEHGLLKYDLDQIPQLETSGKIDQLFETRLRAATLGHANSMVIIAKTLHTKGRIQDSFEWFKKAADLDHPEGHYGLYLHYKYDKPAEAFCSLSKAGLAAHPHALPRLIQIYEKGTDQIKPDQKLVDFWRKKQSLRPRYLLCPIQQPSTIVDKLIMPKWQDGIGF